MHEALALPIAKILKSMESHKKMFGQFPNRIMIPISSLKEISYLGTKVELTSTDHFITFDNEHWFQHIYSENK